MMVYCSAKSENVSWEKWIMDGAHEQRMSLIPTRKWAGLVECVQLYWVFMTSSWVSQERIRFVFPPCDSWVVSWKIVLKTMTTAGLHVRQQLIKDEQKSMVREKVEWCVLGERKTDATEHLIWLDARMSAVPLLHTVMREKHSNHVHDENSCDLSLLQDSQKW